MVDNANEEVTTREVKSELNVLRNPDGSAMLAQGK